MLYSLSLFDVTTVSFEDLEQVNYALEKDDDRGVVVMRKQNVYGKVFMSRDETQCATDCSRYLYQNDEERIMLLLWHDAFWDRLLIGNQ